MLEQVFFPRVMELFLVLSFNKIFLILIPSPKPKEGKRKTEIKREKIRQIHCGTIYLFFPALSRGV